MSNWITVMTFVYPQEAHLAKNVLESEGIKVFLKDELAIQVNNFYSPALGGVKLQIQEENKERALEILTEAGYLQKTEEKTEELEVFSGNYTKICPYCHSSEVRRKKGMGLIFVVSYILGAPLPIGKYTYHCFDCGKEWKVQ